METKKENLEQSNRKKISCCNYGGHWLVKITILVVVLLILAGGIAAMTFEGRRGGKYGEGILYKGLGCNRLGQSGFFGLRNRKAFGLNGRQFSSLTENFNPAGQVKNEANDNGIFGNITRIEDNKITIFDNSAKEQTVLSLASTVISSSTAEIGIKSLQVGQNIIVEGSISKDNIFEAKSIKVQ